MNYELHIKSMENPEEILVLEFAEKGSVVLNYLGSDDKTQPIVGSEVVFTMEVLDGSDGKYIEYFTSDEQGFEVTKVISAEQIKPEWTARAGEIIWRGYMLPESYSEPWDNPTFYPEFSAVDGLGLLKGKTLSPDFYSEEKSVIEVISACLQLTGIDFDIFFSPAISNLHKEYWHEIFIDTRKYHDDKLPSAYDILEDLVSSLRCQLFQADARWYVEGINKRHLGEVKFYRYDILGTYKGAVNVAKTKKVVDWSPGTMLQMMAPLKEVVVSHEAAQLTLPEEVIQESQRNWRVQPGVPAFIYPAFWNYTDAYKPVMRSPEYYLELPNVYDGQNYPTIELREKPYVLKGWRIKFEIEVQIVPTDNLYSSEIDEHIDGDWIDVIFYDVQLNGKTIAANTWFFDFPDQTLKFDRNFKASASIEYLVLEDGFLNISLWAPLRQKSISKVEAVRITKLNLEKYDQEKDFVYTQTIEEKSSRDKEIELEIADDVSGISNCFYLEKQREYKDEHFRVAVEILDSFVFNGENYAVVDLAGANLIEQFIDSVMNGRLSTHKNLEVIYNFNGGEDMVIKSDQPLSSPLYVKVQNYKEPVIDRYKWLEWNDAIYGVGKKRYAEVVAEIEAKLFSKPHLVINGVAQAPAKFNELIQFRYRGENKFFVFSNLSWNGDINESTVTLVEAVYGKTSLGNIPPYVYAGPDIVLKESETSVQITEAEAYHPNGQITSLIWEKIEGDAGEVIMTPGSLNPAITGLTGDNYTFRLTANDTASLSASDTMRIIRVGEYEVVFGLRDEGVFTDAQSVSYFFQVSPAIPAGEQLVIHFDITIKLTGEDGLRRINAYVRKQQQGNSEYQQIFTIGSGDVAKKEIEYNNTGTVTLTPGTTAWVLFASFWNPVAPGSIADYEIRVTEAYFQNGNGVVSNLPVSQSYEHNRPNP